MKKKILLDLHNVHKIYHVGEVDVPALRGINLAIKEGEFVAILGKSGSGKCITGDSEIFLKSGKFIPIKNLKAGEDVVTFDIKNLKFVHNRIEKINKRKVNNFLTLRTRSGRIIHLTREHPLFTINEMGFVSIKAKDLKKGSFIMIPRKIEYNLSSINLKSLNHLSSDKNIYLCNSSSLFKETITHLGISRKEILNKFKYKDNTYDYWRLRNNIPLKKFRQIIEYYGDCIFNYDKKINYLKSKTCYQKCRIPKRTSKELLEIYGYLAGDGWIDKTKLKFINYDNSLKERIKNLIKNVFDVDSKEYKLHLIEWSNSVLFSYFKNIFLFPIIKKSNTIKLPPFIYQLPNEEVASFIRALFDCDSYISKSQSEIKITLASKELVNDLMYLFLRFGIVSRYSETKKKATNSNMKKKRYYSLTISGLRNLRIYSEEIGFLSEHKKKILGDRIKNFNKEDTNVDVIPLSPLFSVIKKESNIQFKDIKRLTGKDFSQLLRTGREPTFENAFILFDSLKKLSMNHYSLTKFKQILDMNPYIFWDKIKDIKKINKRDYVYDLIINKNHNFIANGILIHNSTLLNQVGCLDIPTKGTIHLDEFDIQELHESDLAQIRGRKIGFVFQSFNLIPSLTALENVALPMVFQGVNEEKRIKRAIELLTLVGLKERMHHIPSKLSGGEQQRVAIARALANDPEIILADEPTGNLDSKTEGDIMNLLAHLHKKSNKTIIMITHNLSLSKYAERVVRLEDGRVIE